MPRRSLESRDNFGEISPDVGTLDETAMAQALEQDPDAALGLIAEMTRATDKDLRALARRLAGRLFLDLAHREMPDTRGIGRIVSVAYRAGETGDLDIDRSLDGLLDARSGQRLVDPDELRVQTWAKPTLSWCLLVDRSGSMDGQPAATAALAAAAVAVRCPREYAVLSFGRDVVAPKAMWEVRAAEDVVDRVLALRAHGTTDVGAALRAATEQLRASSARRRITVLLSDCRSTEPGDVVAAARAQHELVIIAPEGDSVEAAQLADAVGARWTTASGPSGVVEAFARVLDR